MLSAQLWPWVTVIVSSLFLSSFTVFPGHTLHSLIRFSTPDCSPDSRLMCPTACFMFRRHPYLMSKTELPVSRQTSISCGLSISVSGSSVFAVAQARLLGPPLSLTSIPPTSHAGLPSHGVQNPTLLTTSALPAFSESSSSPSKVIIANPCLPTSTLAPWDA